ncbi:MAG: hypothetical protein WC121_12395 [Candidatus Kapaibacterium sp.]
MIKIVILIMIVYSLLSASCLTDEEIKERTISFCNKLIENPDSITSILQNEKIIRTDLITKQEYSSYIIEFDTAIIKAQKRNDFFLSDFKIQSADIYSEKLVVLHYKKHDNLFYNIYSYLDGLFGSAGCNNNVTYLFKIQDDEIYFLSVSICQHMQPSILDE